MLERNGPNRGELARAQLTLQEAETKLERLVTLLAERREERHRLATQIQEVSATGDMDRLVDLQNRAGVVEKTINELREAEAECTQRVESARRYLYTL